jgi:hypothetical protein
MRTALTLLGPMARIVAPLLLLASCDQPMLWEKPGADAEARARDLDECRAAASDESNRNYYPASGVQSGSSWRWPSDWPQRAESQRFYAETNLTRFCMRNKGWELIPASQAAGK